MKKSIAIITLFWGVMVCCQRQKTVPAKQETDQQVISSPDTNEVKALKVWNAIESKFNERKSMAEKDSILMEMFHTKLYWDYSRYLEPKFDSTLWTFLQDERTFYYPFKSESPKWFVSTSEDEKVKMYSYEQSGGTAMFGRTVIQYIDELGHFQVKELTYEAPDHGVFIPPIFKTIKKTKQGYTMYGGTTVSSQEYYKASELLADTFFVGGLKNSLNDDSFTVIYRQPVNGYKVKALIKYEPSDDVMSAELTFSKNGESFTLHTTCFGDSIFCKGRMDYQSENPVIFRKYRNKTVYADYHEYKEDGRLMPIYTPFFFRDLDFDGIEELVIVHRSMAVRYHDGYDVYRIVEGEPKLIDYPPYIGITDYPEFDYNKKTISCPYPEGEISYIGRTIYGISKKQKDTVIINGRKHYFNHLEVIEDIKYDK